MINDDDGLGGGGGVLMTTMIKTLIRTMLMTTLQAAGKIMNVKKEINAGESCDRRTTFKPKFDPGEYLEYCSRGS